MLKIFSKSVYIILAILFLVSFTLFVKRLWQGRVLDIQKEVIFKEVEIEIDYGKIIGKTPEVMSAGIMGVWWDKFEPMEKEVGELNKKPVWRIIFGFGDMPGSDSATKPENFDSDFESWLNNEVNPQIKKYQQNGDKVVVSLGMTLPKWLSLYPDDGKLPNSDMEFSKWFLSPPSDYAEWDKLIMAFVRSQRNFGIYADYIIGDEPNWLYYGTEEQYFEQYAHTARAIKTIDENIRVGGPAVDNWFAKKSNCPATATGIRDGDCPSSEKTMLENFVRFIGNNNVPLDFIDWHFPEPLKIKEHVPILRNWLKAAGLDENMPVSVSEWVFSHVGEEESTERAASYMIPFLYAMADAGVSRHTATSRYDQEDWLSGDWRHVGFFTADGIIKPKWNVFKLIDKLIYNSSGYHQQYKFLMDEKSVLTTITSRIKEREVIKTIVSNFTHQSSDKVLNAKTRLVFKNLPFSEKAKLVTYTVDNKHSNYCRYNKDTERRLTTTECGLNGAVNQAVENAKKESNDNDEILLSRISEINARPEISLEGSRAVREVLVNSDGSFVLDVVLPPYSVVYFELTGVE